MGKKKVYVFAVHSCTNNDDHQLWAHSTRKRARKHLAVWLAEKKKTLEDKGIDYVMLNEDEDSASIGTITGDFTYNGWIEELVVNELFCYYEGNSLYFVE